MRESMSLLEHDAVYTQAAAVFSLSLDVCMYSF